MNAPSVRTATAALLTTTKVYPPCSLPAGFIHRPYTMPATERISIPLEEHLLASVASCEESINNAVAAYAVKHRLLLEEVAAYYQGVAKSTQGHIFAVYLVGQRMMSYAERNSIRKCASAKAKRNAA